LGLASGLFTNDISEAVPLRYDSVSEAVLLQLNYRYASVSVEGLVSSLFTNNVTEAVLLQLKHKYKSVSVWGLVSSLFTNDISEAVFLQLKHRYGTVSP
jgi:hypothetical protein